MACSQVYIINTMVMKLAHEELKTYNFLGRLIGSDENVGSEVCLGTKVWRVHEFDSIILKNASINVLNRWVRSGFLDNMVCGLSSVIR